MDIDEYEYLERAVEVAEPAKDSNGVKDTSASKRKSDEDSHRQESQGSGKGTTKKGGYNSGIKTGPRTKHTIPASISNGRSFQNIHDGFPATGYGATLPGGSQMAPGLSASVDSGSMDSPSLGSDSVMIHPGTNSAEARAQNTDSLGDDLESPDYAGGRKKKRGPRSGGGGEKGGRGLRHFSMKVCEKVESKGRTTYNEVADELVAEFTNGENLLISPDQQQYDEKNIRRRVYDALNVLMAMDIIAKEKKEIQWKGLPSTEVDDIEPLKTEHMQIRGRIEKKAAYLKDLEEQIVGIQNLIERNESLFQGTGSVPVNGVALPFILVQTRPHATVEVEISEDMQLVHFDFNSTPFELHDDAYVLKAMTFGEALDELTPDVVGGHGLQPEYLNSTVEDEGGAASSQRSLQYASPSKTSALTAHQYHQPAYLVGKTSASLPLPGILKARVKHESHP